jgi:hypothetical protein
LQTPYCKDICSLASPSVQAAVSCRSKTLLHAHVSLLSATAIWMALCSIICAVAKAENQCCGAHHGRRGHPRAFAEYASRVEVVPCHLLPLQKEGCVWASHFTGMASCMFAAAGQGYVEALTPEQQHQVCSWSQHFLQYQQSSESAAGASMQCHGQSVTCASHYAEYKKNMWHKCVEFACT